MNPLGKRLIKAGIVDIKLPEGDFLARDFKLSSQHIGVLHSIGFVEYAARDGRKPRLWRATQAYRDFAEGRA